jgi:hypothetical protein
VGDSIGLFFWSARMPKGFKIIVTVCVVLIGGQVATAQQNPPASPDSEQEIIKTLLQGPI